MTYYGGVYINYNQTRRLYGALYRTNWNFGWNLYDYFIHTTNTPNMAYTVC